MSNREKIVQELLPVRRKRNMNLFGLGRQLMRTKTELLLGPEVMQLFS